jgi:hypothetical protein
VRGWGFGLVCGFFYFVFQNLFGVVFFLFFRPPPVFTTDNCFMNGAPPEDGDAEGRAPKRGRLNMFGELGKLYDAGLQAQKEAHEQEMQALREAHKQEVQKLNAKIQALHAQPKKRGGPASVSCGSAVHPEEPKRLWMIKYDAAHVMTMDRLDRIEFPEDLGVLEGIDTIHLSCPYTTGRESYVSVLYFKDPLRFEYMELFCDYLFRSKLFPLVRLWLEFTCVGGSRFHFLGIQQVEMWGVGPNKQKILCRLRAWEKRGYCMRGDGGQLFFPFKQLHA